MVLLCFILCCIIIVFIIYTVYIKEKFEKIYNIVFGIYAYLEEKDKNQNIKIFDYIDIDKL